MYDSLKTSDALLSESEGTVTWNIEYWSRGDSEAKELSLKNADNPRIPRYFCPSRELLVAHF